MNRTQAKKFRSRLDEVLKTLEAEFDAEISIGRIKFTSNSLSTRLELREKPAPGQASLEAQDFVSGCRSLGLSPDLYLKKFQVNGKTYELCGLKPRSPRYPLLGRDSQGHTYKFTRSILSRIES